MKQNEFFVFPNEETGFDPSEIDLLDPSNFAKISPNLFRVQKIGKGDYWFRHHLETELIDRIELNGSSYKRIRNPKSMNISKKISLNHIGRIVNVGEF
jgi:CRISPR-associated endonuclease Csn1